jgi:hypothetical protein
MKRFSLFPVIFAFVLGGCAAYKELEPEPLISPAERGYIQLKNDAENFMLDKGKKYFIKFPRPQRDQFFLILATDRKRDLTTYLTRAFDDGKPPITKMQEEPGSGDSLSVYAVDTAVPEFFWVIDYVPSDLELAMHYRYAPRWRYTFETKYVLFRKLLAENIADRTTYEAINPSFNFNNFNFNEESVSLELKTRRLADVHKELLALESLFPSDIASSRDTAYEKYKALKKDVTSELQFQKDYATVLTVFREERDSRGRTEAFLAAAPMFLDFMQQRDRFPRPMLEKGSRVFLERLPEAQAFYERQLFNKNDTGPVSLKPPIDPVEKLYTACGSAAPASLVGLHAFVDRYNIEATALQNSDRTLKQFAAFSQNKALWSSDSLYAASMQSAADVGRSIPESQLDRFPAYKNLPFVMNMRNALARNGREATAFQGLYQTSRAFLSNANAGAWPTAESILRDMHADPGYLEFPAVATQRGVLVRHFEDTMFQRILGATQQRADSFMRANQTKLENVSGLYADPAFTAVYQMTFSAGGKPELARKQRQVQEELDNIKYRQFPENAIRSIYKEFTSNMNDRGVLKARAIVEHGKNYRGTDKQLKAIVEECDPNVPKTLTRPKDYRRILALPITNSRQGSNEYLFRVSLQIPSEASFPVFDVNIKLPEEVARNAGTKQWYDRITINNSLIKNEGRFRITSPSADNNYESLITPVQMDKGKENILEVRFTSPTFKVFEVSAMAQVPIIRKN